MSSDTRRGLACALDEIGVNRLPGHHYGSGRRHWYDNEVWYYWIIFGLFLVACQALPSSGASLLPEPFLSVLQIATIAYLALPPAFACFIPAFVKYIRRRKKEKSRNELERLVRSFELNRGVIPLVVNLSGISRKVKAELKGGLWKGMDQQMYVTIDLSYSGNKKEVPVRNSWELRWFARDFVSTVLKKQKNEREENKQADDLLRKLKQKKSAPKKQRKALAAKRIRKKSLPPKIFLTSRDKLEEARKNFDNGVYPSAITSTTSALEQWLREVLDIDDTIEHINPQNIVEQWKKNQLPHSDEVGKMAEILSLVVPTKHPPLYNPSPKECVRYIRWMDNLIQLRVKVSDQEKQTIKSNLHIDKTRTT
jgi:hypothetical protein